ncbi:MAG: non-hydrolyzing UDP-N-acetylglucosamine 2-epimerase [Candidatus Hydrothermarchaeota archaeon]
MRVLCVIGSRPEIIKMAPVIEEFVEEELWIIHTGQHYDYLMSMSFIEELGLPGIDKNLEVGSGTHAYQTSSMIIGLERIFNEFKPDVVIAEGDTNSVVATSLTCSKLLLPFAHVESGLRSFDMTMPEEVNRILADHCSELLFAPTEISALNLIDENVSPSKIFITGNTIVDACKKNLSLALKKRTYDNLDLDDFILMTLHRAENVDDKERLKEAIEGLKSIDCEIVFPVHPRTEKRLKEFNLYKDLVDSNITMIKPLGYLDFLNLLYHCKFVMTDSGGIQEEAIILKKPCLTLRENTERPETVMLGANILVGIDKERMKKYANLLLDSEEFYKKMTNVENPYGDGTSGEKIAKIIREKFEKGELKIKRPDFRDELPFRKFMKLGDRHDNKSVEEIEEEENIEIMLIIDEAGVKYFPRKDFILKRGSIVDYRRRWKIC